MKFLPRQGNFRILTDNLGELDAEEMNRLIKTAGTTCYQTREASKKTPKEFIQMLQGLGHLSVLEHSWFTFFIGNCEVKFLAYELWKANSLFCITERTDGIIVSGNARVFNEAYAKDKRNKVVNRLIFELNGLNPVLFPQSVYLGEIDRDIFLIFRPILSTKEEKLVHRAMTVEFNNVSRGFTHEDVRSRNGDQKLVAYSQESTRYVDYAKGETNLEKFEVKFIPNYSGPQNFDKELEIVLNGTNYRLTPRQMAEMEEAFYRTLRKNGWRPEEARQWLPIGTKSQIVQTYNLNEWRHWFKIRASKFAHPEIRFLAVELLAETQRRTGLFDDFKFEFQDDNTEYAYYAGDDNLV